jgi:hypothetical protein
VAEACGAVAGLSRACMAVAECMFDDRYESFERLRIGLEKRSGINSYSLRVPHVLVPSSSPLQPVTTTISTDH